jgi:hypothetical protein
MKPKTEPTTTSQEWIQQKQPDREPSRKPDYAGDGIAVWINTDKTGTKYLAIRMIGHNTIYARSINQKEEHE